MLKMALAGLKEDRAFALAQPGGGWAQVDA